MAVLVRQLRDSSDEIPEAIADLQSVELTEHEWQVLYAHCQMEVGSALNQNPTIRVLNRWGIPGLILMFLGIVGLGVSNYRLQSKMNDSISRGKEAVATFNSNIEAFNEHIRQSNFRIGMLESSHSSASVSPVADKDQQVQWINFDAAKMALEGRKVESIRLEVRSSLKKPKAPKVEGALTDTNSTGNGVANSSTMDSAKPVQSSH